MESLIPKSIDSCATFCGKQLNPEILNQILSVKSDLLVITPQQLLFSLFCFVAHRFLFSFAHQ